MALQMSWQLSLIHQKRRTGPPLGLRNLGNSCYLNSVLQCLTYTPPLANFCLKHLHSSDCDSVAEQDRKRDCPFCILEKRIARSLSVDLSLDTPAKLNSCLKVFAGHFRLGRQEDAHEFLRYVIDACHNTCLRLKKLQLQQQKWRKGENSGENEGFSGSHTVVKEIFGGSLQSQVKCLSCGLESNKVDEIMDISLDVLQCNSLEESMKKFFQFEVLDGNNKYKCDKCKQLVKARKQMSLFQAPNVLVIQLKRFEGIFGGKIDRAISFQEVLVLSSYMSKASQDPYPDYNLFGTIVHSGFSPDSGHYYAYVKDAMGRWYCCNDGSVKLSNLKEVLSEKVYILFFSRTKQRPVPTKAALVPNGVKSEKCNGRDALKSQKVTHLVPIKAAVTSNGVKSQDSNGGDAYKSQKMSNSVNEAHPKHAADLAFEKNTLTPSKVNDMPSNTQPKLKSNGNSSNKMSSSTTKISIVLNKSQSNGKSGHLKPSSCIENSDKNISPYNGNGVTKCGVVQAVGGESSRTSTLANGNGKAKSSQKLADVGMTNGNKSNGTVTGREYNNNELQNGVSSNSDISGYKRKLQVEDSCVLLARDDDSRKKLEEFKEGIGIEASSVLRSCGWTVEVLQSMRARKKLCLLEAGHIALESKEFKNLLISDAKRNFLSQIPPSLKEKLIESIRTFSREN